MSGTVATSSVAIVPVKLGKLGVDVLPVDFCEGVVEAISLSVVDVMS